MLCNCTLSSQTNQNISKGTTITESWFSPSGDFAFGFLPLHTNSSLFLLAVWFSKTVGKAVVWSANGNLPVLEGSKLQLTIDGQFLLIDHTGSTVWNPYPRCLCSLTRHRQPHPRCHQLQSNLAKLQVPHGYHPPHSGPIQKHHHSISSLWPRLYWWQVRAFTAKQWKPHDVPFGPSNKFNLRCILGNKSYLFRYSLSSIPLAPSISCSTMELEST